MALPSTAPRPSSTAGASHRWLTAVAIPVAIGVVLGALTVEGTYVSTPCPSAGGSWPSSASAPQNYVSETVDIPYSSPNSSAGGPLTTTTFQGVRFQLWPLESGSLPAWALTGVGTEPSGIGLTIFLISPWEYDTETGATLASLNWTSLDGAFAITWVSNTTGFIQAELRVADPAPSYRAQHVAISPFSTETVCLDHVRFQLSIQGWGAPVGDSLAAAVTEPNGTTLQLSAYDGTLLSCAVNFPAVSLPVYCTGDVRPEYGVGLIWDGESNAMVLVGAS